VSAYVYLVAFLAAASIPLLFLAIFAVFRWRYSRMVRRAIYADAPAPLDVSRGGPVGATEPAPLILRWSDAAAFAAASDGPLDEARRETRAMRTAFVAAGVVFIALVLLVNNWRDPDRGYLLGYVGALPALWIVAAFARTGSSVAAAIAVNWALLLFLILGSDIGAAAALPLMLDFALALAPSLIAVALLLRRATYALLVGFVPAFAALGLLSVLALNVLPSDTLVSPSQFVESVVGLVLGTALAVLAIRKQKTLQAVLLMVALTAIGLITGGQLALVGPIGGNGLFVVMVWAAMRGMIEIKRRGWAPDEVLHFALCLLVPTTFPFLQMDLSLWQWVPYIASLLIVVSVALWRRSKRGLARAPRLLLLRVFGAERVSRGLLDALEDTWRRLGTVDLVVGPDVAVRTVGAASLENFLMGRAHRQFIATSHDLDRELHRPRDAWPALDLRYALHEWYCLPDTWPDVVTRLVGAADVALVDLRGFGEQNRGVAFELSILMQRMPLERVVLITDATTNEPVLTAVLERARKALSLDSPNAQRESLGVDLIRCSGRRRIDADAIAAALLAPGRMLAPGNLAPLAPATE